MNITTISPALAALEQFGAQLGETAWHAFSLDPSIDQVSLNHFNNLTALTKKYESRQFLEVACYAHYTGHMLQDQGIDATLCDISPHALRQGRAAAIAAGHSGNGRLVASDFHELPFEDASFDFVYVSAAVHHSVRPDLVLEECLRVLAKGGILHLRSEPCQRNFAFHKFRANRRSDFTPFEKHIDSQGLLRIITSYLFQARPEQLFGMVENDRIPISTYLNVLDQGESKSLTLDWKLHLSELDELILKSSLEEKALAEFIEQELHNRLDGINIDEREQLIGICAPSKQEIAAMSAEVASAVRAAPETGLEHDIAMTNIFGAALELVFQKTTGAHLRTGSSPLAGDFAERDGVLIKPLTWGGFTLGIHEPLMPDIQTESEDVIRDCFPEPHWDLSLSQQGIRALIPRHSGASMNFTNHGESVLVIRLHTPCEGEPYKISLQSGDQVLDQIIVAQTEGRIIKLPIMSDITEAKIIFSDLHDNELPGGRRIRIPVFQLFPVTQE